MASSRSSVASNLTQGKSKNYKKEIIDANHEDMSELETSLSKLKALKDDDKTENALLRSRIDEQSQLIMILKQRMDEAVNHARTLERTNEALQAQRDEVSDRLQRELQRYNLLDARFTDLAENHEEMIKFKDEYKKQNEKLRLQIDRLFSNTIEEKENKIKELDKEVVKLRTHCARLEQKNKDLTQMVANTEDNNTQQTKKLQETLKVTQDQLQETKSQLEREQEQRTHSSEETQTQLKKLKEQKDELLNLTMSRGKLIQDTQSENKRLRENLEEMERRIRDMQAKFENEAALVNKNLAVQKLRKQINEAEENYIKVMREFSAYKKHSTNLLEKERDLNEKLRHLVS